MNNAIVTHRFIITPPLPLTFTHLFVDFMTYYHTNKKKYSLFSGVILLAALAMPSLSFAHAKMVRSSPEGNAVLTESPKQVDVWFDDKVGTEYKALAVIDSKGKRVDNKDMVQEATDLTHFYVTVPLLAPDTYTVRYRAVSIDTHIVTGKYQFTIKAP